MVDRPPAVPGRVFLRIAARFTVMYTVTVTRDFIAQYYLTVPDPGPEGELHSQHYRFEVTLRGPELNEYNYLVDIDEVKAALSAVEERYADETLNELPEFDGNPSVEQFARVVCDRLLEGIPTDGLDAVQVRVWEAEDAAAGYERSV